MSVESNVDPDYDGTLSRAFVALEGGGDFEGYIQDLGLALQSELRGRGVVSEVYVRDELSLDGRADIEERISTFGPDGILIISQTEASYVNGAASGTRFKATLMVPGRDGPVWRAAISSDTGGFGGAGSTIQLADKIVSKMEEDGLFAGDI